MAKKRARDDKGAFIADNPDTPENEAWIDDSPKTSAKKQTKYSYGINSKKDFPPPGTAKYKMMVLAGEIKE